MFSGPFTSNSLGESDRLGPALFLLRDCNAPELLTPPQSSRESRMFSKLWILPRIATLFLEPLPCVTEGNKTQPLLSREMAARGGLPLSKQEVTTQCAQYCDTGKCKVLWDRMTQHVSRFERSRKAFWKEVISELSAKQRSPGERTRSALRGDKACCHCSVRVSEGSV